MLLQYANKDLPALDRLSALVGRWLTFTQISAHLRLARSHRLLRGLRVQVPAK